MSKSQIKLAVIGTFCALCALLAWRMAGRSPGRTDEGKYLQQLAEEVRRIRPGAWVLTRADVDWSSCGTPFDTPGMVSGDFDADGLPDCAVIVVELRSSTPYHAGEIGQKQLCRTYLMIFSVTAYPQMVLTFIERLSDQPNLSLPVGTVLGIHPPGTIQETESADSNRVVKISQPGVWVTACESASIVYFWDDDKHMFDKIWTSN